MARPYLERLIWSLAVNNKQQRPLDAAKRSSVESRRQKAKRLRALGHSYSEIAKMLGVSKSQAYRLVNS